MKDKTALLAMSGERRGAVIGQLEACGVQVLLACGLAEARAILAARPVDVIICAPALPDGDWRGMLALRTDTRRAAQVIVCAERLERKLCADAFQLGVWEVVPETCPREELRRTIESALSHSYMQSLEASSASSVMRAAH